MLQQKQSFFKKSFLPQKNRITIFIFSHVFKKLIRCLNIMVIFAAINENNISHISFPVLEST